MELDLRRAPRRLLIAAVACGLPACGHAAAPAPQPRPDGHARLQRLAGLVPLAGRRRRRACSPRTASTVELKYFDSYTDSLTALATGNVDANSQTLNDTLTSVSGGAKQTIVLVNDNSTGNDQIIARPGITTRRRPQGQDGRRRAGHGRPLPAAARPAEGRADRGGRHSQAAAHRRRGGRVRGRPGRRGRRVRAVHHHRAGACRAARRSRPRRSSPARSPTTWSSPPFVAEPPDRGAGGGEDLVRHPAWIAANKDEAIDDHGQEGRRQRRPTTRPTTPARPSSPGAEPGRVHPGHAPRPTSTTRPTRSPTSWSSTEAGRQQAAAGRAARAQVRQGGVRVMTRCRPASPTRPSATAGSAGRGRWPALPRRRPARRTVPGAAGHPRTDPAPGPLDADRAVGAGAARWPGGAVARRRGRPGHVPAVAGRGLRGRRGDGPRRAAVADTWATRAAGAARLRPGRAGLGAAGHRHGQLPGRQALFEPVIGLLRYLPASAFIPLLIIWLGIGEPPKIALLFIGTVFFNTLMTADVGAAGAGRADRRVLHARRPPRRGAAQGDRAALAARHDRRGPGQRRRRVELRRGRRADRPEVGPGLPDRPRAAVPADRQDLRRARGDRASIGLRHRRRAAAAARPGRAVGRDDRRARAARGRPRTSRSRRPRRALDGIDLAVPRGRVRLRGRRERLRASRRCCRWSPGLLTPTDGRDRCSTASRSPARARPRPGVPGRARLPVAHRRAQRRRSGWSCCRSPGPSAAAGSPGTWPRPA